MARLPLASVTPRPGTSPRGGLLPTVLGLALAAGLASNALAQTPGFHAIDAPAGPAGSSKAFGLSGNGQVAAGSITDATGLHGMVWTGQTGRYDFGVESGVPSRTSALGISADASTVVGSATGTATHSEAFRWRGLGTYESLGVVAGAMDATAYATSADGSVVVGESSIGATGPSVAFRWSQETGMEPLPIGGTNSYGRGVSGDGSRVVGIRHDLAGHINAFLWTRETGVQILPHLNGTDSAAFAVNDDGRIVVGWSGQRPQATLWRDGVPMGLGYSIGRDTTAFGVSGDGTVVVGDISLNVLPLSEGFVWTQGTGMMTIYDYLAFHGVLVPPGWELWHLTCVSGDGNTIGGWGQAPDGSLQGFVATVPSPATAAPVLACAVGSLLSRRRRV